MTSHHTALTRTDASRLTFFVSAIGFLVISLLALAPGWPLLDDSYGRLIPLTELAWLLLCVLNEVMLRELTQHGPSAGMQSVFRFFDLLAMLLTVLSVPTIVFAGLLMAHSPLTVACALVEAGAMFLTWRAYMREYGTQMPRLQMLAYATLPF